MAMEDGDATPQGTPTRDGNADVLLSAEGSTRLSSGKKLGLVKDQLTVVEARGPKGSLNTRCATVSLPRRLARRDDTRARRAAASAALTKNVSRLFDTRDPDDPLTLAARARPNSHPSDLPHRRGP